MRKAILVFLIIGATVAAQRPPPERPFWRTVVMGANGMIAAEHPLEAQAGFEVLRAGGNAIDAAVAAFYMTGVVEQHQAGIGGDAFILAYIAKENRVVFINGTGVAPKLATQEFYVKLGEIPESGPYASEVPGSVSGFDLALKKYGTKDYATLLRLAIEIAEKGHPLTYWSASNYTEAARKIARFPSSVRVLTKNGTPYQAGEVLIQADLGHTLRTIASEGADSFYRGSLARLTVDFYQKNNGLIRAEDLASYRAEEAAPVSTDYKGYRIYEAAPNSQGIALLMALNILEDVDLRGLGQNSAEYLHWITETLKLVYGDRDYYISDPRFKDIPIDGLLSKKYAAARRELIRKDRAIRGVAPPGDPGSGQAIRAGYKITYEDGAQPIRPAAGGSGNGGETSSFSVADRWGNIVSVTHSVNGTFGSGMIVEGGGYVLNNRMPYFYLDPKHVNVLAPGKRTLHTINPAIAMRDGKPFLAFNTPGGDNQPQAMLQAFLNVVEFGMNVQQAVESPTVTTNCIYPTMFPHKPGETLTIPKLLADRVGAALAAKGHRLNVVAMQQPYGQQPSGAGAVKMILIDPKTGVMHGGVSPAKDDYVMGW